MKAVAVRTWAHMPCSLAHRFSSPIKGAMDNKNIVIVVLAILFIAASGVAVYFARQGPVIIGQKAGEEVCDLLPLFTGQFFGSSSDGIGAYIAQDICHLVFAHETGTIAMCDKTKTPQFKGECYSAVAMKAGDVALCDKAPLDARDQCFSQFAEKLGDAASCDRIKTVDTRDNCVSNFASRIGDGMLCKKITNVNTRDYCYTNTARNNPALCNSVQNPNIKQDCLRNTGR